MDVIAGAYPAAPTMVPWSRQAEAAFLATQGASPATMALTQDLPTIGINRGRSVIEGRGVRAATAGPGVGILGVKVAAGESADPDMGTRG